MAQPTTQLNATEQDTLVKQIGLALLRAAPRDWRRVTATYRAVGRYHELTGEVLLEDGSAQEWMATHDIATLFGRLRAGMYREGRGTWFNARYQLDHPSSYNLEYDRDEPRWDLMPPPQAYADELRMFPRSEDNVPEWLMRRMAGLAPEQPGPRFRLARIFDGHEPSGRPVLNRPELDADEQQRVLEYLNNAPVVRAERGFDLDRLAQQPAATVPVAFHTDGTWIWPAAVNYYLQEYGVAPEAELVQHIAGAGYALPEVPEQTVQAAAGYLTRGTPPPRPPRGVPEQAPAPADAAPEFESRAEEPASPPQVEQPTTLTPVVAPDAGPPTMLVQPVGKDEPESREGEWDETPPRDGVAPEGREAADQGGPETRSWDAREALAEGAAEGPEARRSWDQPDARGQEQRGWEGREDSSDLEDTEVRPPETRAGWEREGLAEPRGGQEGFAGPEGADTHGAHGREAFAGQAPPGAHGREGFAGPEAGGAHAQDQRGWDNREALAGTESPEQRGGPAFAEADREPRNWEAPDTHGREAFGHETPDARSREAAGHEAPDARGRAAFGHEAPEGRGGREAFLGQEAPDARGREGFGQEAPEPHGRDPLGQEAPEARGREAFAGHEAPDRRGGPFAGQDTRPENFAGQEPRPGEPFPGQDTRPGEPFTGQEARARQAFAGQEPPAGGSFGGQEPRPGENFTGQDTRPGEPFTGQDTRPENFTGQEARPGESFAGQEARPGAFAGPGHRPGPDPRDNRPAAPDHSPPTMVARPVAPPSGSSTLPPGAGAPLPAAGAVPSGPASPPSGFAAPPQGPLAQPSGATPQPSGPTAPHAGQAAPQSGPAPHAEPALANLRSKLADLGVPDAAYRIGEPAEHGWSLEKVDDGWRVGWYDEALTSPAVFGDADDAAAFMLGKLLLSQGGRTAPPARPEITATEVPRTPAQQRDEADSERHNLPQRALSERLDEPDPAGPPTMLAAPPVPPPPPRREPPPRRVEPAAAASGGNQQWPIQPMPGEPPLTLFRGKEMRELPAGSELDRFGGPNGNLTYAAGTPFEERSLVPEWVNRPYHVYRVQRPIEALAGVAIPWFNQPGGGAAYLLPASIEDLLASGDLIELDPGEPPID
ncbi:glycohydrolase toxin TNT-related protein [Amycolatopsis thermophila]|uniref:TNT domain-containing protein n=1 Tax=Amycolatopsis thermophila TaxID=206084 RepID=A0ABU0EQ51_9PSEU|nr:glycohydrolase toxin TNT-related protein [Amycolatopsis thermophila]MDQ0377431.1 hypothetical protein [Amycolatopsis thermophila]